MGSEMCIRDRAKKINAVVIATSAKNMQGFPDMTHEDPDKIVELLIAKKIPGVFIHESETEKIGEVAVKAAIKIAPLRARYKALPSEEEIIKMAEKCVQCGNCVRACPHNLPIEDAMLAAKNGNLKKLAELYDYCIACIRCEKACRANIPILTLIMKASEKIFKAEKFKVRAAEDPYRTLK